MKKFLLSIECILLSFHGFSQWSTDTTQRNAICTAAGYQYEPLMCSDGHGGAILVWADQRNSSNQDIYAQRIDSIGNVRWTTNGIRLSLPPSGIGVDLPLIVTDDSAGAIIFYDVLNIGGTESIYAQRLNENGIELWPSGGVPVSTAQDSRIRDNENAANNNATPDGAGGAFITWQTYSPFNNFVQHIGKNGNPLWGANGESITSSDSSFTRFESYVVSTGGGTAIVGYSYYPRLYLQHINTDGSFMWGTAGVVIADSFYSNSNNQNAYIMYDSLSSDVFAAWDDVRNKASDSTDIYAQKVDFNGNILWQPNGIAIATAAADENAPDLITDKNGGFFISYDSGMVGKVQHVNSSGQLLWGKGIRLSAIGSQTNPVITDDGSTGVIAEWHDERGNPYGEALFAQRYDQFGNIYWRPNGIPVITKDADQNPSVNPVMSVGNGNAIVCWSDFRVGVNNNDIYAAEIGGIDGVLPVNLLSFTGVVNGNKNIISWKTSQEINAATYTVERSADGLHFNEVETVTAQKNSNMTSTYSVSDATTLAGNNFYRLKETDIDGKTVYSKVIDLVRNSALKVYVYPNPVKNKINIAFSTTTPKKINIILLDASGSVLRQQSNLSIGIDSVYTFDVSQLPKGIYIIRSPQVNFSTKIIKE